MPAKIEHKTINNIECKHCWKCNKWLSLNCFCKNKNTWDNLRPVCNQCQKQWRLENKEYLKRYRADNKKKVKQYNKKYQTKNHTTLAKHKKIYYKTNSKKISVQAVHYRKQHPLYSIYNNQLKKYEKIKRCQQNNELIEVKCAYCGRWIKPTNSEIKTALVRLMETKKAKIVFTVQKIVNRYVQFITKNCGQRFLKKQPHAKLFHYFAN